MKKNAILLKILFLLLVSDSLHAINYRSGDDITIDSSLNSDSYIACKNLILDAPVHADLTAAVQSIVIHDSIYGDLMLAAETITLNSYLGDDARVFCRTFTLNGHVKGDVIVFSGDVIIASGAVIEGDLVIYSGNVKNEGQIRGNVLIRGGKVMMAGTIEGNVNIKARELELNGTIKGNSIIAAEKITLGNNYFFRGKVNYWQEDGPLQIDSTKVGESPVYDPSLAVDMDTQEEKKWAGKFVFLLLHILYGALLILLLSLLLPSLFTRAGRSIQSKPGKSLGIGILYFISVPFIVLFLFIILIGLPIGLLLFFVYIFTLVSGFVITSLVIANFVRNRLHKNWSRMQVAGIGLLVLLATHLILWIPYIGFVINMIVVTAAFGALLLSLRTPKRIDHKDQQ